MRISTTSLRRLTLAGASALTLGMTMALALPATAQDAPVITAPPLEYMHRELANGLDVYAMPDPSAGTVTVQMWYDVGGKDDPEGRSGFAHLFEHILSRKTVNIPYGHISTIVENAGGSRNASTGQDFTNYYETVPPQYLETMLWTHAERMARPVVDQAVFDAERSIVKEELRERVYAPPYGRLSRFVIGDNQFDQSIYRRSVIGSIEQLDAATIDDARAFHEAYYRPATATLIVSGNFDPAQLDRWVDQYFGAIQNPDRPVPVFERPVSPPRTQPRRVDAYAPNVPLAAIAALFPGVPETHPDNAALEVLQAIMSRGQSSRLYRALVYDAQVATGASFGVDAMEEAGSVMVSATASNGAPIADLEAALDVQIARARDELVTPAELNEAKTELLSSALRGRETASGRAFLLGQALVGGVGPDGPDRRLAAIQAVTAEDVQRAARLYLDEQARVSIRYQDESQRPEGVAEDSWRNPAPVPTFLSVPPAVLAANELLPEDQRMAPPAPGEPRAMAAPVLAERMLPNGLRIVVAQSTDLPIVNVQLVTGGGSSADPADRPGLAGMTAGLMDQGAGGRGAPEIAQALETLGANVGGGAGADASSLFLSAPIATADQAGALFADVVMRPDFAEAEVARRRSQTANAIRVGLRQPGPVAAVVMNRLAYGAAPYGAPSGGTPNSIGAITRDEIAGFHQRWWRPDGATLIVTGGMAPEAAFAFAERMLGGWGRPQTPAPTLPDRAGAVPAPRVVVVDLPGAGQAAVSVAVRGPRRADDAFYPLSVTSSIIGGGQNGHLFQEIRARRGLSYGAYSSLTARRDGGLLVATTQTKNESAAEVVDLVLAQIRRGRDEPVADQRITERETFITGAFARSVETTGGLGDFLGNAVALGLPLTEVETYPGRIAATTPDSLAAASTAGIDLDQAYVVVVGQADMFIDALRAAHPDVVVIPSAELNLDDPTLGL